MFSIKQSKDKTTCAYLQGMKKEKKSVFKRVLKIRMSKKKNK